MNNELYHHGIKGQQWGKRNGPPYPLDAKDHSAAERKAGWQKSLSGRHEHESLSSLQAAQKRKAAAVKTARHKYRHTGSERTAKAYALAKNEARYAKEDIRNFKTRQRLLKQKKKSRRQLVLEQEYLKKRNDEKGGRACCLQTESC